MRHAGLAVSGYPADKSLRLCVRTEPGDGHEMEHGGEAAITVTDWLRQFGGVEAIAVESTASCGARLTGLLTARVPAWSRSINHIVIRGIGARRPMRLMLRPQHATSSRTKPLRSRRTPPASL